MKVIADSEDEAMECARMLLLAEGSVNRDYYNRTDIERHFISSALHALRDSVIVQKIKEETHK